MKHNTTYIYGRNAVATALQHKPDLVQMLWIADHINDDDLIMLARAANVKIHSLQDKMIERHIGKDVIHQGIIASVPTAGVTIPFKDFIENLEVTPKTCLAILGEVQDPQNVGAIIRSAAAFGVSGVLIPQHNQSPVTPTVIKVSAGTAFTIPLVTIGNVNQSIGELKEKGFWIYGLDGEADLLITEEKFEEPTAIVIGNEGDGLRAKTKEHCDILIQIPMNPEVESLNAGSSAAVAFYDWSLKQ